MTARSQQWLRARTPAPQDTWLSDEQIEELASRAFAPHRCHVSFPSDGRDSARRLALRIVVAGGNGNTEFVVQGMQASSIRQCLELRLYLDDVRQALMQRGVRFTAYNQAV
jgi:hypothetical protein